MVERAAQSTVRFFAARSKRVGGWKLWTLPYNAAVIVLASATMIQSKCWEIRKS
jgi:hypothetical protein